LSGERSTLEPRELLTSNLALVERAIAFASRRHRLDADDADEFASVVKLRLVDNDYAILRAYEERSSFATYISVVVQRMALDFRIHAWGKWHASAEAKRLGELAVELEQLLHRDGRSLDDALAVLAPKHGDVSRADLAALAARLPERKPRRREVDLADAEPVAVSVEDAMFADDRRLESQRVSTLMASIINSLPDDDRVILQLRFEGGMTVAQIARALQLDQKLLYRRIDRRLGEIKKELLRQGIAPRDILDLIGRDEQLLRFDLGKTIPRPSIGNDERATAQTEGSQ